MTHLGKSPFDDAAGQAFLQWFALQGGLPSAVYDNVTPAGTVLADATPISLGTNIIRTTANNAGIRLPNASIGSYIAILNADANNDVYVWPPDVSQTLDFINSAPGAYFRIQANGGLGLFRRISNTEWSNGF